MKNRIHTAQFFLSLLFLGFASQAMAFGGKVTPMVYPHRSLNWRVAEPKVVIAFGLIQESLVKRYTTLAQGYVQDRLHEINPNIQIEILPKATGQEVVEALMNRNTVGFIFISHSFKTENTKSTIMTGADGHELPTNLLSAATPALRFISFLGCHGPSIFRNYEIDFQLKKPNGFKLYFQPEDQFLSTQLSVVDNLKKMLKTEADELKKRLGPLELIKGVEPDFSGDGTLTVRVKDVFAQIEPRYIKVNDQIVGLLGSDESNSNSDQGYRDLTYRVPSYAFRDFSMTDEGAITQETPSCHDVRLAAAELTPGFPADNYLIQSVTLSGPFGTREKSYSPAWHIGDQELPPAESEAPVEPNLKGASPKVKRQKIQEYLLKYVKYKEWLSRDPDSWKDSPLKGRFYKDCF